MIYLMEKKVGRVKEKIKIPCPTAVANYSAIWGSGFECPTL
jgi:hypothetical protein